MPKENKQPATGNNTNPKTTNHSNDKRDFKTKYQFTDTAKMILKPSYVGRYGDVESCFLEQSVATCSTLAVELVVPQDHEKWIEEIQQLYIAITAKYTGHIGFSISDLEHYVINVRALRAALLDLRKLYLILNSSNYDTSFFKDMRSRLSAYGNNPIEMVDFYNQKRDDLLTSYPLNLGVLKRDTMLFDKLYKDNRVSGSTYYDFSPSALFVTKTSTGFSLGFVATLRDTAARYASAANTFSGFITAINAELANMNTPENAQIANAIRATFLNDRNAPMPELKIGDSLEVKYDKLIGLAISNGVMFTAALATAMGSDNMVYWSHFTAANPSQTTYSGSSAAAKAARDAALDASFHDCALNGIRELGPEDMLIATMFTKAVYTTASSNTVSTYFTGVGLYNLGQVSLTYNEYNSSGILTDKVTTCPKYSCTSLAYNTATSAFRGDPDQLACQTDCEWFPRFLAVAEIYSDSTYDTLTIYNIMDSVWDVEDYSILSGDYVGKYKQYDVEQLMYVPELTRSFNLVELK